ncbi:hypothetical protein BH23VER1_BH23VER1_27630 [soil metagenome]
MLALALSAPPRSLAADAPLNPRVAVPLNTGTTIELAWEDNSVDEDRFEFEIYLENASGSFDHVLTSSALRNQTLVPLTGGSPGDTIQMRVRAISSTSGNSPWSGPAQATLPEGDVALLAGTFVSGFVGQPIAPYTPVVLNTSTYSASDLPPGLSVSSGNGVITGAPEMPGVYRTLLTGSDGSSQASTFVTFRIDHAAAPPTLVSPLADLALTRGDQGLALDLDPHFTDADTAAAVRMETTVGTIDILLFPRSTPASVENFLDYVNGGELDGSLFHRVADRASAGVDIVQSGWFKPAAAGGGYVSVPTDSPVPNEPGFPNARGTFAMAKQGGNPNSGTSQTYFNVTANPGLDTSGNNGGFTVFGRATTPSLPVIDTIFALPRGTYSTTLDGAPLPNIPNWPTLVPPAGSAPAPDEIVQSLSLVELHEFLTFAVTGNTDPAIASATTTGPVLTVIPLALGSTTVTVAATDLDGNQTQAGVQVDVSETYASWSAPLSFPDGLLAPVDDGDLDGIPNLLEYALLGNPAEPDPTILPLAAGRAISFPHLKASADLTYLIESSPDLQSWSPVWQSDDGIDHPAVTVSSDQPDHWKLTVSAPAENPAAYLRLRVILAGAP